MNENNPSSGTGIMVAAVVGALVGAGVALLFAPGAGKETRGWLAHRTRKLKESTINAYMLSKDAVQRTAKEISDGEGATRPHTRPFYGKSDAPPTRS